jgi:hypothetical protein
MCINLPGADARLPQLHEFDDGTRYRTFNRYVFGETTGEDLVRRRGCRLKKGGGSELVGLYSPASLFDAFVHSTLEGVVLNKARGIQFTIG